MTLTIKQFITVSVLIAAVGFTAAANAEEPQTDLNQTEERTDPDVSQMGPMRVVSPKQYPFLNLDANHIIMNGASWTELAEAFENARENDSTVSIVHIGDSHIQSDGNTGRIRKHLQNVYGNAGRGLMTPLRLARTNQPLDFNITTVSPVTSATLLKMPWPVNMGFTGVSIKPEGQTPAVFTVDAGQPFDVINIYADKSLSVNKITEGIADVPFHAEAMPWGAKVKLDKLVSKVSVSINTPQFIVNGFDVRASQSPGVLYHNIGNNGASYSSYSTIGNFGEGVALLQPDLVIVSLGTNEAFGRMSSEVFRNNIDALVKEIRESNPEARILLTTPSECQKSVYTRTRRKGKKRRGKRRTKTRVVTSRSYQINTNVSRMRDVIMEYGAEHNIPVYDFYTVAGGQGSSAKWLRNRLLSNDRIHRTWSGYYLEGDLLYEAISDALNEALEDKQPARHKRR